MARLALATDRIICLLEANPYSFFSLNQICIQAETEVNETKSFLDKLTGKGLVQKTSSRGDDIYRYFPQRR